MGHMNVSNQIVYINTCLRTAVKAIYIYSRVYSHIAVIDSHQWIIVHFLSKADRLHHLPTVWARIGCGRRTVGFEIVRTTLIPGILKTLANNKQPGEAIDNGPGCRVEMSVGNSP